MQVVKGTFRSVWFWLGIIFGAIALINLGVVYADVGIGPVLERIVTTYKATVHIGYEYLFFRVDWSKMPGWLNDALSLNIVMWSAAMRAEYQHERKKKMGGSADRAPVRLPLFLLVLGRLLGGILLLLYSVVLFVFWPLMWSAALLRWLRDLTKVRKGPFPSWDDGAKLSTLAINLVFVLLAAFAFVAIEAF